MSDDDFRDAGARGARRPCRRSAIRTTGDRPVPRRGCDFVAADAGQEDGWPAACATGSPTQPDRIRVFYLATARNCSGRSARGSANAGLADGNSRVVVEKPIGKSLASAREVNDAIGAVFPEDRVYRIDHYLGKETVQNLMALRFANALFEPLWNGEHIDHVQITVAETLGVEGRAGYYDTAGALRDMVQNHMLQLLCLVAMEPPRSLDADAVRDEKLKVLKSLVPIDARRPYASIRCAASTAPVHPSGGPVTGYLEELGRDDSHTETFVALQGGDRQLALGRRAVLPAHRQAAGRTGSRRSSSRSAPIPHSVFDSQRRADRRQPAGHPAAARRGRETLADDQGPRPRRHAAAARPARHELRREPSTCATPTPTNGC